MSDGPATKKAKVDPEMDKDCINQIRCLSVEMVQQANSGHPGAPLGCAPMAYTLFCKGVMNYSPSNPKWINRDRFILSNGHSCALLYSMLHLTGYEHPTMEDCKNFRQMGSPTAGHPENHLLEGVEVPTGPLGQGISNAVGLAMASEHMAARYNKEGHELFNNFTYVICGDGCLQEGVASEACSLAGHLKLGKLIVLYDDNNITIDGNTDVSFTEDVGKRFEAYGWQVLEVKDGNTTDVSDILKAVEEAKACTDKPTIIKVKTVIGFGAAKAGTAKVHGSPLGWDDVKKIRGDFGFDPEAHFTVKESVASHMGAQKAIGDELVAEWNKKLEAYKAAHKELGEELQRRLNGELPEGWESKLPEYKPEDKDIASRASSGQVLNAIAAVVPEIVGGSADLTGSNLTNLDCSFDYQAGKYDGRYFRFGVREHGAAAICNGIAAFGANFIPFHATFLNFTQYCLGAMRLSALGEFRVIAIMTHDSIGLGEDGPTHQPVEALATLRAMPNMYVFRPADAREVAGSYIEALKLTKSPSTLALSRQNLPNLEGTDPAEVAKGAYVVYSPEGAKAQLTLVATGSEVTICIEAAKLLGEEKIRTNVVSMPCMELFDQQDVKYKKSVFAKGVPVVSVEAGSTFGWQKYSHYQIGVDTFGRSAPAPKVYDHFGITPEKIKDKAALVKKRYNTKNPAPHLVQDEL